MHVDYSSCVSPRHVDPLSVESMSAEKGVHSPISVLTVCSTAICSFLHKCSARRQFKPLFKHLRRNSSNCFSSLVPPTKPVLGMLHGRILCLLVQGSGWPSLPEHFCCGSLQAPHVLVFIAAGELMHRGAIAQHGELYFPHLCFTFLG